MINKRPLMTTKKRMVSKKSRRRKRVSVTRMRKVIVLTTKVTTKRGRYNVCKAVSKKGHEVMKFLPGRIKLLAIFCGMLPILY